MHEYTFQVFEAFTAATVIYILINAHVGDDHALAGAAASASRATSARAGRPQAGH